MRFADRSLCGLITLCGVLATGSAQSAEAVDPHAAHRAMMAQAATPGAVQSVLRSLHDYAAPEVSMIRADGAHISLPAELDDGRPVYLNFIYTTCTTICPLSSQVFSQLQRKLGDQSGRVHLVSISIDPEQDTPARLREYAHMFGAGAAWQHYTGTVAQSLAVQRAFSVYKGDKMRHTPVTLFRAAPGKPWVRLDGFATADELLQEYRELAAAN